MKKHLIPNKLLPERYQGKGYTMNEAGVVYGQRGHALSHHTHSPNGFNHPIVLDRNVWWIRAMMFVDNPNQFTKVVEIDGEVIWISDETYFDMMAKYNPQLTFGLTRRPVSFKADEIVGLRNSGEGVTAIAKRMRCSRKAVYNILKKRGIK